jgi:hypothetical protein
VYRLIQSRRLDCFGPANLHITSSDKLYKPGFTFSMSPRESEIWPASRSIDVGALE